MSETKRPKENNKQPLSVTAFFTIALLLSGYLAISSLQGGTVAGCGPESSCDAILKSRWAYWFGLPVSVYSALFYIAALVLLWAPGPWSSKPAFRATALMTVVFLIPGAAFWFIGIQWLEFDGFCQYCMATHAVGIIGAILLWRYLRTPQMRSKSPAWTPALGGLIGMTFVLALASGQMLGPAPSTAAVMVGVDIADSEGAGEDTNDPKQTSQNTNQQEPTETGSQDKTGKTNTEENNQAAADSSKEETVSETAKPKLKAPWERRERLVIRLHRGQIELPVDELPKMGNPDAERWVISLFDYTCKHCREMHHDLELALERYGDQIGILSLPTPLDANCNPMMQRTPKAHENACDYARLGLAVWRAKPDKFLEFDEYLFKPETPPTLSRATSFAAQLIGTENLKSVLKDPWINQQIQEDISLLKLNYEATGKGQMPQLLIGNALTAGTLKSVDRLYELVESQFKIAPKD